MIEDDRIFYLQRFVKTGPECVVQMGGFHIFERFNQFAYMLEVININVNIKMVLVWQEPDTGGRMFQNRFSACSMALYVTGGMFDILEISRNRLIS